MTFYIIKPLAEEIEVTTANTVSNSSLVRVFATSTTKVTLRNSSNVVLSSITVIGGEVIVLSKTPTDTLTSALPVLCVPIAFR